MADAYITDNVVRVFEWEGHIVVQCVEPFTPGWDEPDQYDLEHYISYDEDIPDELVNERMFKLFAPFGDTRFVLMNGCQSNRGFNGGAYYFSTWSSKGERCQCTRDESGVLRVSKVSCLPACVTGSSEQFDRRSDALKNCYRHRSLKHRMDYIACKGVVWTMAIDLPSSLTDIIEFDRLVEEYCAMEIDMRHPRSLGGFD